MASSRGYIVSPPSRGYRLFTTFTIFLDGRLYFFFAFYFYVYYIVIELVSCCSKPLCQDWLIRVMMYFATVSRTTSDFTNASCSDYIALATRINTTTLYVMRHICRNWLAGPRGVLVRPSGNEWARAGCQSSIAVCLAARRLDAFLLRFFTPLFTTID